MENKSEMGLIGWRQERDDGARKSGSGTGKHAELIRSGYSEFRNNRQYMYAEKWDEFIDGTQQRKVILDDGYGKRTLKEYGKKLNLDLMLETKLVTDERGYFMHFQDRDGE